MMFFRCCSFIFLILNFFMSARVQAQTSPAVDRMFMVKLYNQFPVRISHTFNDKKPCPDNFKLKKQIRAQEPFLTSVECKPQKKGKLFDSVVITAIGKKVSSVSFVDFNGPVFAAGSIQELNWIVEPYKQKFENYLISRQSNVVIFPTPLVVVVVSVAREQQLYRLVSVSFKSILSQMTFTPEETNFCEQQRFEQKCPFIESLMVDLVKNVRLKRTITGSWPNQKDQERFRKRFNDFHTSALFQVEKEMKKLNSKQAEEVRQLMGPFNKLVFSTSAWNTLFENIKKYKQDVDIY